MLKVWLWLHSRFFIFVRAVSSEQTFTRLDMIHRRYQYLVIVDILYHTWNDWYILNLMMRTITNNRSWWRDWLIVWSCHFIQISHNLKFAVKKFFRVLWSGKLTARSRNGCFTLSRCRKRASASDMVIPRPSPLTSGQPLLTNSYLVQSTLVCTYSTVREPQKQPTSRFERWARIVYATRSITGYPPERTGSSSTTTSSGNRSSYYFPDSSPVVRGPQIWTDLEPRIEISQSRNLQRWTCWRHLCSLCVWPCNKKKQCEFRRWNLCEWHDSLLRKSQRANRRSQWSKPDTKVIKVRNWDVAGPFVFRWPWRGKSNTFA